MAGVKRGRGRGEFGRALIPFPFPFERAPATRATVPRNTAARKIGNGVISLLRQLGCPSKPDHNKFSSLSNTTVVAIFPNVCLWRRIVYAQTWQVLTLKNCIEPPYRSIGVRLGLITERSIDYAGIKEQITRAKQVPRNEA